MPNHALVVNPYWNTLGGGEKYTSAVIAAYEAAGFSVDVVWNDTSLINQINHRFGITIHPQIIARLDSRYPYDQIFVVSDGSVPMQSITKTIVHFQVPFQNVSLKNRLLNIGKLRLARGILCNSHFTKTIIDQTFLVNSQLIYPPCQIIPPVQKTNSILAVGRFDGLLHDKRQDVLIRAFHALNLPDFQLVLAGGCIENNHVIDRLKQLAGNARVRFVINADHQEIEKLYGSAKLFWHAAGYQVNEKTHPEQVEHFGLATVEAMSAQAVPLVYDAGGQREIVHHNQNGYIWKTIEELATLSAELLHDEKKRNKLALAASRDSQKFSMEQFVHDFTQTYLR